MVRERVQFQYELPQNFFPGRAALSAAFSIGVLPGSPFGSPGLSGVVYTGSVGFSF